MKIREFLFYITLASALSSCATMSVRVSVIDQKKLKEMPGVMASQVYQLEEVISTNLQGDVYNFQRASLKIAIDTIIWGAAKNNPDSNEINLIISGIFAEVDTVFSQANDAFNRGISSAELARTFASDDNKQKELLLQAQMDFTKGNYLIRAFAQKLEKDFPSGVANKIIDKQREKLYTITQGAELLSDPLVSFVVRTKNRKKYWKGVYNKTVTRNGFGNSDVAIAMESLGNFTIKGVRLDAANMVAASFKTLSQGIQFISSVYGVPSPAGGGEGVAAAETSVGKSKVDVETKKKELEINSRLSKLSTIAIMEAIVSRRADLGNSTTLPAAVGSIKTTFEIYKPQLTTSKE